MWLFLPQVERYFRGAAKAAEEFDKKLKDLTKSLYEQINLYGRLTSALFEYNVSGKAVDDTVSLLSNRFSEFRVGIEKLTKSGFGKNEESVLKLMKSFEVNQSLRFQNAASSIFKWEWKELKVS